MRFLIALLICLIPRAHAVQKPNPKLTPGVLCSKTNPNFQTLRYAEKIPYCKRKVGTAEKEKVAKAYGNIPKADWPKYEFDHLIPLSVGGADDAGNIWPQPIAEAHEKDKVEDFVFQQMKAGKMKQAQGVKLLHQWFDNPHVIEKSD
jgi:hypothetical protein